MSKILHGRLNTQLIITSKAHDMKSYGMSG